MPELNIPLSVYLAALFMLLVIGVKPAKRKEFHEDFLELRQAKALQGFAAVAIMMHHLTQSVTNFGQVNKGLISFFNDCGVLFTGIFFFFSGYGLYISLLYKPDYLKHFLRQRLVTVLVPFYVINTLFVLASGLCGFQLSTADKLMYLTGGVLLNKHMWFIVEIAVLYLAFYLAFRWLRSINVSLLLMAGFILVLTTVSLLLGHDYEYVSGGAWFKGEWWYNATWLFMIGMLVAKWKGSLTALVQKFYLLILAALAILFPIAYQGYLYGIRTYGYWTESIHNPAYDDKFMTYLIQLPSIIFFVLLVIVITMKLQFHNKVLSFLGRISLELYLVHNIFILPLEKRVDNDFLFYLCVYVGGIILATLIHYLDSKIILLLKGKKK